MINVMLNVEAFTSPAYAAFGFDNMGLWHHLYRFGVYNELSGKPWSI